MEKFGSGIDIPDPQHCCWGWGIWTHILNILCRSLGIWTHSSVLAVDHVAVAASCLIPVRAAPSSTWPMMTSSSWRRSCWRSRSSCRSSSPATTWTFSRYRRLRAYLSYLWRQVLNRIFHTVAITSYLPVLWIRIWIYRILVFGPPGAGSVSQRYGFGSESFYY